MTQKKCNIRVQSSPTPSDYLVVCPKCGTQKWTIYIKGYVYHCLCGCRQREAKPQEYEIAKKNSH